MSRKYCNIRTLIWRPESEFIQLSDNAQRVWFLLTTQGDISACGLLSLNLKRWAGKSSDGSREKLRAGLRELQQRGFVVFDENTEEVLVCTFTEGDNGYGNPKRRPVILAAAAEVESQALRRALAKEFAVLGLPSEGLTDSQADSLCGPQSDEGSGGVPVRQLDARSNFDHDLFSQEDSLSDRHAGSDRVVVSKGPYVDTSTLNPQPTTNNPPPPAGADKPRDPSPGDLFNGKRTPTDADIDGHPDFAAFWNAYPLKKDKGHARKAWLKAVRKGTDPKLITKAAEAFRDDPHRNPQYTAHPATWLNGERWNDDPTPPPHGDNGRAGWAPWRDPDDLTVYDEPI